MNQYFYSVYLHLVILISIVVGIPFVFFLNDKSSKSANAGFAFASSQVIYIVSISLAQIISKFKILENKTSKIAILWL